MIKTRAYTAGLPVNQLAGHAWNIGFWAEEIAHSLLVIDGYSDRFKNMRLGQRTYAEHNWLSWNQTEAMRPGIMDHERIELRRRLVYALLRLLTRPFKEGLIIETQLDHLIDKFNLGS